MKTTVLKISDPDKDLDNVRQAASCLSEGRLVVFPTETVYGIACRVAKGAIKRLDDVKKRAADKRYSLHIGNTDKIDDYVPRLTLPVRKLIQNALPGPLTIVFQLDDKDISTVGAGISSEQLDLLYQDNTIGIRCPDEPIAAALLGMCDFPVVAPSANISGRPPATDADQAISQLDGVVDIILDAGPCKLKESSTVVKISGAGVEILRAGAVSKEQVEKLSTVNILFVCTGNTCRSPMAEGLAKKELAGKLKCNVDQLEKMGYKIESAGITAVDNISASPESVSCCSSRGVDIASHFSRRLTAEMLDRADYIFALSAEHLGGILSRSQQAAGRVFLLDPDSGIADPIGGSMKIYQLCCRKIEKSVNKRISELLK